MQGAIAVRASPNQRPALEDIVGRDDLVERLIGRLEAGLSLLLLAERRIGKTVVLNKLGAVLAQRGGVICAYRDLEGCLTVGAFAAATAQAMMPHLGARRRWRARLTEIVDKLPGTAVGQVVTFGSGLRRAPWAVVDELIRDTAATRQRVVLLWDEFPVMIANLRRSEGDEAVRQVLLGLRQLRAELPEVRMVLTGSIGLRRALHDKDEIASVNDLDEWSVEPLEIPDAKHLVELLFVGENVDCRGDVGVTAAVALAVDCVPFYIHHFVKQMVLRRQSVWEPGDVAALRALLVANPPDDWNLRYFDDRLDDYFTGGQAAVVRQVLDTVAAADGMTQVKLHQHLRGQDVVLESAELAALCRALADDHYLVPSPDGGGFCFRYALIRDWWCEHRGVQR